MCTYFLRKILFLFWNYRLRGGKREDQQIVKYSEAIIYKDVKIYLCLYIFYCDTIILDIKNKYKNMTGVEQFLKHEQLKTYFSYQRKEVVSILALNLHTVDTSASMDTVLEDVVEVFFDNGGRYFKKIADKLDDMSPFLKILLYDQRIIERGAFYVLTSEWVKFYLKNTYWETIAYYYANIIERLSEVSEIPGEDFRDSVPEIFANDIYQNLTDLQNLWLIKMTVWRGDDYMISV